MTDMSDLSPRQHMITILELRPRQQMTVLRNLMLLPSPEFEQWMTVLGPLLKSTDPQDLKEWMGNLHGLTLLDNLPGPLPLSCLFGLDPYTGIGGW